MAIHKRTRKIRQIRIWTGVGGLPARQVALAMMARGANRLPCVLQNKQGAIYLKTARNGGKFEFAAPAHATFILKFSKTSLNSSQHDNPKTQRHEMLAFKKTFPKLFRGAAQMAGAFGGVKFHAIFPAIFATIFPALFAAALTFAVTTAIVALVAAPLPARADGLRFETLQGNFTQTLQGANGARLTYTGEFFASVKNAFWHYKTPVEKRIFFSYQEIVIIDPELEQAIISKVSDAPNLSEILASARADANGVYRAAFDGVTYEIRATKAGVVREISYTDKLQNAVKITFSARKNQPIRSEILTPKIPRHFDILRSR